MLRIPARQQRAAHVHRPPAYRAGHVPGILSGDELSIRRQRFVCLGVQGSALVQFVADLLNGACWHLDQHLPCGDVLVLSRGRENQIDGALDLLKGLLSPPWHPVDSCFVVLEEGLAVIGSVLDCLAGQQVIVAQDAERAELARDEIPSQRDPCPHGVSQGGNQI